MQRLAVTSGCPSPKPRRPVLRAIGKFLGLGAIASVLLMFVSCQDSPVSLSESAIESPQFAISDASHETSGFLSNKYFHFLPPVVWPSSVHFNGEADLDLFPEIEICLVDHLIEANGMCDPAFVVDRFSRNPVGGEGRIKVKRRLEMYLAWWDARDIIDRGDRDIYRANIFIDEQVLGFADIQVVRGLFAGIRTVYEQTETLQGDDDFAAIPDGFSILAIPFRLEQGVLCDPENEEQCVTETITLSATETVEVQLVDETTDEVVVELVIPGQGEGSELDGAQATVTIQPCPGMTDLPLDIPLFDECFQVAVSSGSLEDLDNPASVCIYETPELNGLSLYQAQLVTLHEQDEITGEVISLPHSSECEEPILLPNDGLRSNPLFRFAKQLGQEFLDLVGPAPLEANAPVVTHRGRGGSTDDIRSFFQFGLPVAQMYLDPADASRTLPTGSQAVTAVKIVDLRGDPAAGATVHFDVTSGALDDATAISGPDGVASVIWTTDGDGTGTASGFGIAAENSNGPRTGDDTYGPVDPFMPFDEVFDLITPPDVRLGQPVQLASGELTFEVTEPPMPEPGSVLYEVNSNSDGLSTVDVATGNATFIGELDPDPAIFVTPISMAVRPSDGQIFVWNNSNADQATGVLLTVDACTGLATPVNVDAVSGGDLASIAHPSSGNVIFGAGQSIDGLLYSISTIDGSKTVVGPHNLSPTIRVGGMDFHPTTGELWGVELGGTDKRIVTINTSTGAATEVSTLVDPDGEIGLVQSIVFDAAGKMIGSGNGPSGAPLLFDIDPSTGVVSNIRNVTGGSTPQGMGFAPACTP